jgi:alpha-tubulin suppressor-like RCC1 family protein
MHRWKSYLLLVAVTALLSACGGGNNSNSSMTATSDPLSFYQHTAVFVNNTTLYVWGANESGQIGNGTTSNSSVPVLATRFANYSAGNGVAIGSNHTLAFQKYSTVRAWGFNRYGQLGNGLTADNQTPNSSVPVTVRKWGSRASLSGVTAVAAGGYFSLALDRNGTVWSWGKNDHGQLGRLSNQNTFGNYSSQMADKVIVAAASSPLTGVTAIAAGAAHALALKNDGTVWGWGYNEWGQVGDGSPHDRPNHFFPVLLPFVDSPPRAVTIAKIAAGNSHSLALDSDGYIWAWGYNYFGQLGNNLHGENVYSETPIRIPGIQLTSAALIAAGASHSLAYDPVNDILYTWGCNVFGQLGDGTTSNRYTPVAINGFTLKVLNGTLPASISASWDHSHARKTDGSWWSWGENSVGQLGIGNQTNQFSPVRVRGM